MSKLAIHEIQIWGTKDPADAATKTHPLNDAFARVGRAGEHTEEIKRLMEIAFNNPDLITLDLDGGGLDDPKIRRVSFQRRPPIRTYTPFSILIGEACYNLRSSLDYLISALSRFDSGTTTDHRVQFPIEDRPKDFTWRVEQRGALGGMNARHRTMIEDLQPYKGCNWTKPLKTISNPDKHTGLTSVSGVVKDALTVIYGPLTDVPAGGVIKSTTMPRGLEVHVHFHFTGKILLADGTPIIETLEILKSQVADTLDAFKPEFERP